MLVSRITELAALAEPNVPCCDLCDPSFLDQFHFTPPQKTSRRAKVSKGEISAVAVDALESWRDLIFERDYPTASWESSALLSDLLIQDLASIGPITMLSQIKPVLATQWVHWNKYGQDILDVLTSTESAQPADDTVTLCHGAGSNERPSKRPRLYAPSQSTKKSTKRKEKLVCSNVGHFLCVANLTDLFSRPSTKHYLTTGKFRQHRKTKLVRPASLRRTPKVYFRQELRSRFLHPYPALRRRTVHYMRHPAHRATQTGTLQRR